MRFTVTARIAGGFALMLTLLAGLLWTGISAISRINDGLIELNSKTKPLVVASGQAQESLLQARLAVNRFYLSKKLTALDAIEAQFNQQQARNEAAMQKALGVSQVFTTLSDQLKQVQQSTASVFQVAPDILAAHREDLQLAAAVAQKRSLFTDMSDEIESNIIDLQARAGSRYAADLDELYDAVMGASDLSVRVLDRPQRMAVLSARSTVQKRLQRIEGLLSDLSVSFSGSSEMQAVAGAFQRFKTQVSGDDGFLALYVKQLLARDRADDLLAQLDGHMDKAVLELDEVVSGAQAIAQSRANKAQETVSSSRFTLLAFFGLALVVAVLASLYIIRSIREPLQKVVHFLTDMAQGDVRYDLSVQRDDELGELAKNTNILASRLREALLEIHQNAESLAGSSGKSTGLAEAGDQTAKQQMEHTRQFAISMTEMVNTVREVASSASQTLEQVRTATEQADSGQQVVNDNIQSINSLEAEIARAADVIAKLNERSNSISEVLEVIRNIANQTNLLALNAAIEAARAGEQGRGFAVVADEVRTLASRTQDSTTEIQDMIERLQQEAREAVNVMDHSQQEAAVSVEKARDAGVVLEKINDTMQGISMMNAQIASAAEEQSMVSREMEKNIEEISAMAENTALASKQGLEASADVARLAAGLKQMVGQFKLQS
ncbi:methyl-accepting chemotaxis protein [Simiduia sp. 21SJ11W-1]|uniref:methyl-accepting chemotaxis protein n=1 Tax=Simiduia sp. 21SJ11W-1 TaxID=2909669 RepID=UPI0020A1A3CE|nr:methyl-accepting chemotaxis protein [Simiduia sp. 21SJ11W-1]UTA49140.1 methyl-accepting chemotaxis protein [Simiduia sp. 21SJ11W-1]